jgi:pimeloyl-ACP methyl ester carboxylesterase
VEAIRSKDMTADTPVSPRAVLRARTWATPPAREDAYVESLLEIHLGDDAYPGDAVPTTNWPFVAPGVWGPNNAISGKYAEEPAGMIAVGAKPPIVWIRGDQDLAVSNNAAADLGTLGPTGIIPGYPGPEVYPPQPMLDQIRAVLGKYEAAGGTTSEIVMEGSGHVPYIDAPDEFNEVLHASLREIDQQGGDT